MPFTSLGLSKEISRAVAEKGYTEPTLIQQQAIPAVLAGNDVLAGAQTGSGKTAGFTLPILHLLSDKSIKGPSEGRPPIRALILVPTRELAQQVEESIIDYGQYLKLNSMVMIGGVSINPQIQRLRSRVDILVATPGRLLDHVGQNTVDLSQIRLLVLDEADRMLDMGFIRDIKKIMALLPQKRQTMLFSATFSPEIKAMASEFLNNPAIIETSAPNSAAARITHKVHPVETSQKRMLLAHLIKEHSWYQVLVFTRTKHGANRLADYLADQGIPALAIHGNKSQATRTRTLAQFKDGSLQVLVATDIAARGLDIIDLPHVVNYELPNVPEDYVHRIGRTGRAGKTGDAVSLVAADEFKLQQAIERVLKMKLEVEIVPGFEAKNIPPASQTPHRKQNNNARKVVFQDIKSEQSKFSPKPNSLRSMLKANGEKKLGTVEKNKEHNEQMRKSINRKPHTAALFSSPTRNKNK